MVAQTGFFCSGCIPIQRGQAVLDFKQTAANFRVAGCRLAPPNGLFLQPGKVFGASRYRDLEGLPRRGTTLTLAVPWHRNEKGLSDGQAFFLRWLRGQDLNL